MNEEHVSIRQAAEMLGVSYAKVWSLVRAGRLPGVRIDRAIRIPASALSSFPPYISDSEHGGDDGPQ